jgi:hypothetical protein
MTTETSAAQFAGSIAMIGDRALDTPAVRSNGWIVDSNKIVTTASSVLVYSKHLAALEVIFPQTGRRSGVKRIFLHPQFQKGLTALTAEESGTGTGLFTAVKKHNCAVLYLSDTIEPLSDFDRKELNQSLNLTWASSSEGLSGHLSEIDLSLVMQTLTNAKKQGELVITDERKHPIAQIYCDQGQIVSARYGHLIGQVALHQIVAQKLKGAFFFRPLKPPAWTSQTSINKPTDILLLESFRRLDELERLKSSLGGSDVVFKRNGDEASIDRLSPDVRDIARGVWSTADGLTPSGRLWHLLNLDDYQIFQALAALTAAHLVVRSEDRWITRSYSADGNGQAHRQPSSTFPPPPPIAPNLPLAAFDSITSTVTDSSTGKSATKSGSLLGAIDAYDSWHLIHNLLLLPEAAGTPIFKDGAVVAMHVGALSSSPEITLVAFQQCLWVDSILKCLSAAGEPQVVQRLTQSSAATPVPAADTQTSTVRPTGCVEVATINCPHCGSSSFESARSCRSCGFELIPSLPTEEGPHHTWLYASALASVALLVIAFTAMLAVPKVNFAHGPVICLPSHSWVSMIVKKENLKTQSWETQPANTVLKNGDLIHLHIDVLEPCYIYLLHQTNKNTPEVVLPKEGEPASAYQAGTTMTFPKEIQRLSHGRLCLDGMTLGGSPGDETFLCLASRSPLKFLSSDQDIATAYARASAAYDWDKFPSGFELNGKILVGNNQSRANSLSRANDLVFVNRLVATHGM